MRPECQFDPHATNEVKCCINKDCDYSSDDSPYHGGFMWDAFEYWKHHGYVKARDYPYVPFTKYFCFLASYRTEESK